MEHNEKSYIEQGNNNFTLPVSPFSQANAPQRQEIASWPVNSPMRERNSRVSIQVSQHSHKLPKRPSCVEPYQERWGDHQARLTDSIWEHRKELGTVNNQYKYFNSMPTCMKTPAPSLSTNGSQAQVWLAMVTDNRPACSQNPASGLPTNRCRLWV